MDSERIALTSMPDDSRLTEVIDGELRRALSVQPSPDFAARVRSSIGPADAMRAPRNMYWVLAAAAALVAAVGLATFVIQRDGARTEKAATLARVLPPEGGSRQAPVGSVTASASGRGEHGVRRHRVERNRASVVAARASHPADTVAAVLIDPRQREGLDRLLAVLRSGDTIVPRALADAAVPAQDLTVAAVVVEPLHVPELPVGGGASESNAVRR